MGLEICRVFSQHHDISVQSYLFYQLVDPATIQPGAQHAPYVVSWENAAEIFTLGLEIDLDALPSRNEVFYVFADMPHGKFSNEKAKRILGFQPRAAMWNGSGRSGRTTWERAKRRGTPYHLSPVAVDRGEIL